METSHVSYALVDSPEVLEEGLSHGLQELYAAVFGEPPEYQKWSPEEVVEMFHEYYASGRVVLAHTKRGESTVVVGFLAIIPLKEGSPYGQEAVDMATSEKVTLDAPFFGQHDVDANTAWYIAELGVDSTCRRMGIAARLLQMVTEPSMLPESAKQVLLRVSSVKDFAISLYEKAGFSVMPTFRQEAPFKTLHSDTPVLMTKRLMLKRISE